MNKILEVFKIMCKHHKTDINKTEVKQIFNPALRICLANADSSDTISQRIWLEKADNSQTVFSKQENSIQNMGYIGSMQIEETWKFYYRNLYISNLGYVARFDEEEAKKIFADKFDDLKNDGVIFKNLNNEQKNYIRKHIANPFNNSNGSIEVCLHVNYLEEIKNGVDVHIMVAERFLQKPEDYNNGDYVVHHIDNNSYNNSVTNLIYLKKETHTGKQHQIYHPLSH